MKSSIILFGGNGFIGRHIASRAFQIGLPTVIVSRAADNSFLAKHAPTAKSVNLEEFESDSGEKILKEAAALVYLASRSVPGTIYDSPVAELTDNVEPLFRVIHRAYRINPNIKGIFLSSGGTVYGRTNEIPIKENLPLSPISPYGLGKSLGEQCMRFCGEVQGNRTAILRPSNVVGGWHRNVKQGIVMAALNAHRTGEPLTLFGDGTQIRDFIDADDLADAIFKLTLSDGWQSDVWNIASGVGYSINDVIAIIEEVLEKRLAVNYAAGRGVDVPSVILDTEKFKSDFNWVPQYSLKESIKRIVQSSFFN